MLKEDNPKLVTAVAPVPPEDADEDYEMLVVRARDERNAMRATRRAEARREHNMDLLLGELKRISGEIPFESTDEITETENALIIALNDIHCGSEAYRSDSDLPRRFGRYLFKIDEIAARHEAREAHVFLMGDLINGMIHKTIQIKNRESTIQQVIHVADLISKFLVALAESMKSVEVYSVPGNHSRIDKKEDALLDDRLDDLVMWYCKGVLGSISNIHFNQSSRTIIATEIKFNEYVAVHGDYDDFTDAGCAKLVSYLHYIPTAIFYAHKHTPAMREYNGVMQIQSGSMCGSGDEYTEKHRLHGDACLSVAVVNAEGIETIYNVKLS